jgi:hypothetical protein
MDKVFSNELSVELIAADLGVDASFVEKVSVHLSIKL